MYKLDANHLIVEWLLSDLSSQCYFIEVLLHSDNLIWCANYLQPWAFASNLWFQPKSVIITWYFISFYRIQSDSMILRTNNINSGIIIVLIGCCVAWKFWTKGNQIILFLFQCSQLLSISPNAMQFAWRLEAINIIEAAFWFNYIDSHRNIIPNLFQHVCMRSIIVVAFSLQLIWDMCYWR